MLQFGHGMLYSPECLAMLKPFSGRIAVLTDPHVKALIADAWISWLNTQGIDAAPIVFEGGESAKNRATKERLEDTLIERHYGRETLLVAMGGGVVTDLGGFLASTFNRGIPLMLIPTTLLGMVDAAIGGKTGVNTPLGKNLIGSFYPATHLIIDPFTLETLPEKEWKNGIAEVIKYALIASPPLFEALLAEAPIDMLIQESITIKSRIVAEDFRESGYRRILNFGHTVAHALETLEGYRLPHGEAVAIGMAVEGKLSYRMGLLAYSEWEKIEQLLNVYTFELAISSHITAERLIECMRRDKKAQGGNPRFVLLESIGSVAPFEGNYCSAVEHTLLCEVISTLRRKA